MRILNFQRMSTEDGPGLRTTLFVKGCPLSCKWCHNPESISPNPSVEWFAVRCIGCGECINKCPEHAIEVTSTGVITDFGRCRRCFGCIDTCPTGAREEKGRNMSVEEVFAELRKDKAYFGQDGGVTLSGGEILMQYEQAAELLKLLKEDGIKTAVDTCGYCSQKAFDAVLPYTDLFLYDLKIFDNQKHIYWAGVDNTRILENFEYLCSLRESTDHNFGLWVRTPIIPGATDSEENITALAGVVRDRVDRWELCAFNNLCTDKYERLCEEWEFAGKALLTKQWMERLVAAAKAAGGKNVLYTGRTAMEETK